MTQNSTEPSQLKCWSFNNLCSLAVLEMVQISLFLCFQNGKLGGWGPLTEQLARTLTEMSSGAQSVYSPRPLLEELRKKCPQFRGYDQHDAHELLRELLYAVRTEDLKVGSVAFFLTVF